MTTTDLAQAHFEHHLNNNPYPGRGLVIGRAEDGGYLMVYWIMGRSAHSRNRRLVADGSSLRTEPVDPSQVRDPSLIIYEAMLELSQQHILSNGDQTRTVYEYLSRGQDFDAALATREREPDAPNYTPRITGLLDLRGAAPRITLSLLKAAPLDAAQTDRFTYRPAPPPPGYGFGLTTYLGDGSPLPSFTGDPLLLPCLGTAEEVVGRYYDALHADNRIAVAVKHISTDGRTSKLFVRNRYDS